MIEDAPPSPRGEEGLFHLINWVREARGSLLITSREPSQNWPITLPDLRSRVQGMAATPIGEPDDELFKAVLMKLFFDRQLEVPDAVVSYLSPRIERSFEAAKNWVARLDDEALTLKKPITIPLVKNCLDQS